MTDARRRTTGLSGPAPILAGLAIMTSMALAACAGDAPMEAEPATPVPIMSMALFQMLVFRSSNSFKAILKRLFTSRSTCFTKSR